MVFTKISIISSVIVVTLFAYVTNGNADSSKFIHGYKFKDCKDCPSMIVVRGGSFTMGSLEGSEGHYKMQRPLHKVTVRKFAVGRFEVTFNEWDACIRDGGCDDYIPTDFGWGRGRKPVIYVSWYNAQSYVKWLRKKTGKPYRLLTEAEWEYAARAGTSTPYSFGKKISDLCKYGNGADQSTGLRWRNKSCNDGSVFTATVGSYKPNKFGLYDVHGNVREWVEDEWHENYEGAPTDGSAWVSSSKKDAAERVVRGGAWNGDPYVVSSSSRYSEEVDEQYVHTGFRVARDLKHAKQTTSP